MSEQCPSCGGTNGGHYETCPVHPIYGKKAMNHDKESFDDLVLKALSETPLYTHPTTHYTAFASLIRNEVAGPLLARIDGLNSQCKFWEGTSAYHANRYDELAAEMAGSNVRRLEAENARLLARIAELESRPDCMRCDRLQAENARLKDEVAACQAELAEAKREMPSMILMAADVVQKKLDVAKQDFADVHADYQSCSAQLHQCAQELKAMTTARNAYNEKFQNQCGETDNAVFRAMKVERELAAIKMQEPVAYMFPSDLAKFQEQETFAQAYSVSVGNPSETTVPVFAGPAPIPADMVRVPEYTTGHCENHKHPKGCQLHNIQCGWPECDRRLITASQEKKS